MASELSAALSLEDHEFMRSIAEASAEADREVKVLQHQLAAQGLAFSGARYLQELEIRFNKASAVVGKAIEK